MMKDNDMKPIIRTWLDRYQDGVLPGTQQDHEFMNRVLFLDRDFSEEERFCILRRLLIKDANGGYALGFPSKTRLALSETLGECLKELKRKYGVDENEMKAAIRRAYLGILQAKMDNVQPAPVPTSRQRITGELIDVSKLSLPFEPFPYQLEDAENLIHRKRALIGHDMGLGKTFISALLGMSIPGKKLVICPETLRLNWQRELERTAGKNQGASIHIVYSKDKNPRFDADWTIMGYKTAVKFADLLMCVGASCLFVDEAQKCKAVTNCGEPYSQQAGAVISLAMRTKYVYLLTGTPMPTRNKDLYNILVMLGEIAPRKKYAFFNYGKYYCHGRKKPNGHWDFSGSSHEKELHGILGKYMVRRRKTEVLKHLTKQRIPIMIDGPLNKEYQKIERSFMHLDVDVDSNYLGLAQTGRRLLSLSKVKSAIEYADTLLDAEESVVLVTLFDESMEIMKKYYKDRGCYIHGGMSDKAKQKAIDDFQAGKKKVCCINLLAGGLGVTLTQAHNMIIFDFDWTPANMKQVEDRICRTGQVEHCNIFYLVHQRSLFDAVFMEMLSIKSGNIDWVVDAADNSMELRGMKESENLGAGGAQEFIERLQALAMKRSRGM